MRAAGTIRTVDWLLLVALAGVPLCGLVVLYSAGFSPDGGLLRMPLVTFKVPSVACAKQAIFLIAGVGVLVIASKLPADLVRRSSMLIYALGIILLIAVALFGIVSNGSRRWLSLGFVTIQPAEFVKLGVILAMAQVLSRHPPSAGGFSLRELFRPLAIFLPPMALVARQPDLGTALVIGWAGVSVILFLGVRRRVIVGTILVAALLAIPAWRSLHDYQRNRITSLFNPDNDPRGAGYHINQSKIAVGSGELFGKGFMKGSQAQLEFLPEHKTDFIFSVLAEEWGFVGASSVLCIYFILLQRMVLLAGRCSDLFSSLVIFGISSVLFFHTVVNAGMVLGVLPVVGIPLPLFSYGGSSVISTLFSFGLVIALSSRRRG